MQMQSKENYLPLISVIIPTYNTGHYLRECLDSVVQQTYSNLEILVVDDCSTDPETLEIIVEYQKLDSRVFVIRNSEQKGPSYGRNIAAKHSTGDFITYLDSDDYFDLNFINNAYNTLIKHNTDFVICGIQNFRETANGRINEDSSGFRADLPLNTLIKCSDVIKEHKLFQFPCTPCSKLLRKDIYMKNKLFFREDINYEDNDWTFRLLLQSDCFVICECTGIYRRIHDTSITHIFNRHNMMSMAQLVPIIEHVLLEHNIIEEYHDDLVLYALSILRRVTQTDDPEIRKDFMTVLCKFLKKNLISFREHPNKADMHKKFMLYMIYKLTGNKKNTDINRALYKAYKAMLSV